VKAHRARVMQKMEVGSLAELVRIADKVAVASASPATRNAASERIRDQGPIPPAPAVS